MAKYARVSYIYIYNGVLIFLLSWEQNSPNQGGPGPRFGSPGGRGNFSPRIRGGPDYRGGRGGPRGGFQPRTPQNYSRPPPQFNSEGNNRFGGGGGGGYRGRGNFGQR